MRMGRRVCRIAPLRVGFRGNVVVRDVAAARRLSPRRHRSGGREEVDRRRFSVVGASPSRSSLTGRGEGKFLFPQAEKIVLSRGRRRDEMG